MRNMCQMIWTNSSELYPKLLKPQWLEPMSPKLLSFWSMAVRALLEQIVAWNRGRQPAFWSAHMSTSAHLSHHMSALVCHICTRVPPTEVTPTALL